MFCCRSAECDDVCVDPGHPGQCKPCVNGLQDPIMLEGPTLTSGALRGKMEETKLPGLIVVRANMEGKPQMTTGPIVPPTLMTWCARCRRYCVGTEATHEIMAHDSPAHSLRKKVAA